jgi:hypothetical protein
MAVTYKVHFAFAAGHVEFGLDPGTQLTTRQGSIREHLSQNVSAQKGFSLHFWVYIELFLSQTVQKVSDGVVDARMRFVIRVISR